MTKEKYKEYIQNSYDGVLERVSGWHEPAVYIPMYADYIGDMIGLGEYLGWR